MKRGLFSFITILFAILCPAQMANIHKMSPLVRQALAFHELPQKSSTLKSARQKNMVSSESPRFLTAFVKFSDHAEATLQTNGCKALSHFGNLYIAQIPLNRLATLSIDEHVMRIEASKPCQVTMDTTRQVLDALPVYAGTNLPQAYTGKGVVVGVMDIGFDLTHPTFYSRDLTQYRIKRMWDQLSPDTLNSTLPVGRDYTTQEELLAIQHPLDGKIQTHGTHTTGIAAGSGYNTNYEGMAPGSDICLVANATSDDIELIDSADIYKYTSAIDGLGFKYIFDYAQSAGKPCVINFSEGSYQDMRGDDMLYFEYLDSLSGPGRIIVSSAGNNSLLNTYIHKPSGISDTGTFINSNTEKAYIRMKSDQHFTIRLVAYGEKNDTIMLPTRLAYEATDSEYTDTLLLSGKQYIIDFCGFPYCYDTTRQAYELYIKAPQKLDTNIPLSFEIIGKEADVQVYANVCYFVTDSHNSNLIAGEKTHNINSPSAAESVISVGATSYRTHFINYLGEYRIYNEGTNGKRGNYSSVGPTINEVMKPDVMAPGTNVVSAYSSFYLENKPDAGDIKSDVAHFDFRGRTYAWNSDSGTSMSSPVITGAIALWLEANPHLTKNDIMETFRLTCQHYDSALSYPNNDYGYGEINVYKGLLHILGIDKIETISTRQSAITAYIDHDMLHISLPQTATKDLYVHTYQLNGTNLDTFTVKAGSQSTQFDVSGYPKGVYILQIEGCNTLEGSKLLRK